MSGSPAASIRSVVAHARLRAFIQQTLATPPSSSQATSHPWLVSDSPDPPNPTQADRPSRSPRRRRRIAVTAAVLAVVLLVGAVGYGVNIYSLLNQVHRSNALARITTTGAANGKPLPQAMYAALHSGDQAHGGLNSNVLMVVHIPADGSRASAISIPHDDYVDLPGRRVQGQDQGGVRTRGRPGATRPGQAGCDRRGRLPTGS